MLLCIQLSGFRPLAHPALIRASLVTIERGRVNLHFEAPEIHSASSCYFFNQTIGPWRMIAPLQIPSEEVWVRFKLVRSYLQTLIQSGWRLVRLMIAQTRGRLLFYRDFLSRDGYLNRKTALAASKIQLPTLAALKSSSSVSDRSEYRRIVAGAASDENIFQLFRSHNAYLPILEHVSRELGRSYLEVLRKRTNLPTDWVSRCDPLNTIGGPQKWHYPSIGRFSPTILRYVKVFSDLDLLFGPLEGLGCIEIGVGFGGQAAVLNSLGGCKDFQLYDLPPVLELAKKFMNRSGVIASTRFLDGTNPPKAQQADLLISNYAFSELTRDLQLTYLANSVAQTEKGYITWNSLSPDGLRPEELLTLIPGSKLFEEKPKTARQNVVVVWGTDARL